MTNMFLVLCACTRVYMFTLDQADFYFYFIFYFYILFFNAHYLLVSRFAGVRFNMNCMNVHVLNTL